MELKLEAKLDNILFNAQQKIKASLALTTHVNKNTTEENISYLVPKEGEAQPLIVYDNGEFGINKNLDFSKPFQ